MQLAGVDSCLFVVILKHFQNDNHTQTHEYLNTLLAILYVLFLYCLTFFLQVCFLYRTQIHPQQRTVILEVHMVVFLFFDFNLNKYWRENLIVVSCVFFASYLLLLFINIEDHRCVGFNTHVLYLYTYNVVVLDICKHPTDTHTHKHSECNDWCWCFQTKNFDLNFLMMNLRVFWKDLYENSGIVCHRKCTREISNAKKRLRANFLIIICIVHYCCVFAYVQIHRKKLSLPYVLLNNNVWTSIFPILLVELNDANIYGK